MSVGDARGIPKAARGVSVSEPLVIGRRPVGPIREKLE